MQIPTTPVMHSHQIAKKSSCIVLVAYSSVAHIHPSHVTQLHVKHSAVCNIVWFHLDSPTICPVGVQGMVDQP